MGEKDITEKILEDYPDVFADIFNTLVFHGKREIATEELSVLEIQSIKLSFHGYLQKVNDIMLI